MKTLIIILSALLAVVITVLIIGKDDAPPPEVTQPVIPPSELIVGDITGALTNRAAGPVVDIREPSIPVFDIPITTMPNKSVRETDWETGSRQIVIPLFVSTDTVKVRVSYGKQYEVIYSQTLTAVSDGNGGWQATFTLACDDPGFYHVFTDSTSPNFNGKVVRHLRHVIADCVEAPE